ncbi:MAG: cytochrome c, partial [Acidobacteria bacterium]|nr:cytochrome c [Acidobacteriota bacterium]
MISAKNLHRRLSAATATLGVAGGLLGPAAFAAGQPARDGIHTAGQAENGRAVYTRSCAICHRTDLRGNFESPPLAGPNFLSFWGDLTPGELVERIRTTMPPDRPGRLGDETYLDIVAYLLEANGAPAGDQALTAATAVPIGEVATGETGAAPAITAAAHGRARGAGPRTRGAARRGGGAGGG